MVRSRCEAAKPRRHVPPFQSRRKLRSTTMNPTVTWGKKRQNGAVRAAPSRAALPFAPATDSCAPANASLHGSSNHNHSGLTARQYELARPSGSHPVISLAPGRILLASYAMRLARRNRGLFCVERARFETRASRRSTVRLLYTQVATPRLKPADRAFAPGS